MQNIVTYIVKIKHLKRKLNVFLCYSTTRVNQIALLDHWLWLSQAQDEELEKAINAALEAGYRHIDTAYVYENEKVIGRVLKKWISSGKLKRKYINPPIFETILLI